MEVTDGEISRDKDRVEGTEQIQGIEGRSGNKTVGLNDVIIICI